MAVANNGTYTGSLVAGAAMTGNPFIVAAAAVVGVVLDVTQGKKNKKKAEKLARLQRDNEVIMQTYQNRSRNRQLQQQQETTTDAKIEKQLEVLRIKSRAESSAGENGVQGFSIDNMLSEIERDGDNAMENINRNLEGAGYQVGLHKEASKMSAGSRIQRLTVPGLNYAGLAATAVSGVANAYIKSKPATTEGNAETPKGAAA